MSRARVVLAISTYRSDDAALRLLAAAHDAGFAAIVLVDSLGDGALARAIAEAGYEVDYRNASRNLGSAGNLEARLRAAAEHDADYVYALNHDGVLDLRAVDALHAHAQAWPSLGAVYPARRYLKRGGSFDRVGAHAGFLGSLLGTDSEPPRGAVEVRWSSSNGALYALAPVREGILPWGALFMGYEDLDYGWALERAGYGQHLLGDVVVDDGYEYRRYGVGPLSLYASDKPSWYSYYFARNLALVSAKHGRGRASLPLRVGLELSLTLALRDDKLARLRGLSEGLRDAHRGKLGQRDTTP